MRQSWNFRNTLRARPQTRHRRTRRVENFGFRFALMIIARLAILQTPFQRPNGIPSAWSNARARSSRPAVVTMVTFKPLDLSVLE